MTTGLLCWCSIAGTSEGYVAASSASWQRPTRSSRSATLALVAISTDNVLDAMNMANFIGADPQSGYGTGFHILADGDTSVTREYGVFDLHADGVAAPATFVLDKSGEVSRLPRVP